MESQTDTVPGAPQDPTTNGISVDQFVSVGESFTGTGPRTTDRPRVVVVGAGFAGLNLVKSLNGAEVDITVVDRRNHHLFVPLLYQVATAQLNADSIAQPIRSILKRQKNVTVLYDEATNVDVERKVVQLASGAELPYDYVVIAVGAKDSYFGKDEWSSDAPGLKSLEQAELHRKKILMAFELAEEEPDPAKRQALLTFVIVGGGPTGVEMAGAIAEIANHTLKSEYRNFDPRESRVILLEALPRIFPVFPESLSKRATKDLEALGVDVRTGGMVTKIDADGVTVGESDFIPSRTVIWAAGIEAASLTPSLKDVVDLHRSGRVPVTRELHVPGHPEIFVLGDAAMASTADGKPLGAVAPVAIQMGQHAAGQIKRALAGDAYTPFQYNDRGTMATIGRNKAVAQIGKREYFGTFAWLLWGLVHIMQLVNFRNRATVFTQWAMDYFNYNRNARVLVDPRSRKQP